MAGFKRGLIIGFGVGYVLGAKAGRERYEELKQAWAGFVGSPRIQQAIEAGRDAVATGAREGLHAVQDGVEKAADAVKERLGEEGSDQAPPDQAPPVS